jgi:hypothetical protein
LEQVDKKIWKFDPYGKYSDLDLIFFWSHIKFTFWLIFIN